MLQPPLESATHREHDGGAHPRSRGENISATDISRPSRGSSPLTRGKLTLPVPAGELGRLIPAHAGKTEFAAVISAASGAHPRSRGENGITTCTPAPLVGSSPLTRGKRLVRSPRPEPARLIPAHAGKTLIAHAPATHTAAHPRSRGENLVPAGRMVVGGGSSPLTRGKPHCLLIGVRN